MGCMCGLTWDATTNLALNASLRAAAGMSWAILPSMYNSEPAWGRNPVDGILLEQNLRVGSPRGTAEVADNGTDDDDMWRRLMCE